MNRSDLTQIQPSRIVVIQPEDSPLPELAAQLAALPAAVEVVPATPRTLDTALHPSPTLVVMIMVDADELSALPPKVKTYTRSPLLAVIPPDLVERISSYPALDDFVVAGVGSAELQARVQRLISLHPDSGEVLRRGDLAINTSTCEVSLGGRLIELTFKEYSLLKFLATNPGRVHTRDILLNKVWGYDYYGGDRTVDVHVRRLRSKIEDASHTFIDTVRNMGYRFRKDT